MDNLKKILKLSALKLWRSFVTLLTKILTLEDTGKWISVITVGIVLWMFGHFLVVHGFSMAAMTLVIPYLGQIAITVFAIIGGFKGINSLVEKVQGGKEIIDIAQGVIGNADNVKTEQKEGF